MLTPRIVGLDLWSMPFDACERRTARTRGAALHQAIRIGSKYYLQNADEDSLMMRSVAFGISFLRLNFCALTRLAAETYGIASCRTALPLSVSRSALIRPFTVALPLSVTVPAGAMTSP